MHAKTRDLAILIFVLGACSIPFLRMPFHMDDNFYMDMARNAQVKPLYPNDTPYTMGGVHAPDMGSHSHPPLQTYFLAAMQHFWGEGSGREWGYHLAALIYPLIAVLSFYFLCARFLERPLWPAAALACSPLFMLMQHTLMTDVPMLAFWLAAICSFLYALDSGSAYLYGVSALFQTAAMFTSYQSFALIPLLGFYCLRKRPAGWGWLALLPAPAFMGAWFTMNYFHYHRMVLTSTAGFVQSRHPHTLQALGVKLIAVLEYQGWLLIFPFFLFFLLARGLKGRALPLLLLGAAIMAQLAVPGYRLVDRFLFVPGLAAGIIIVFHMGRLFWNSFCGGREERGLDSRDSQFLGLWYFGVLAYCLILFTEGSARYILPLVPPFLIFYFRQLETSEIAEYRLPPKLLNSAMLASGSIVVSLAWGLALSHADQEFARIYPKAARDVAKITGGVDSYCAGEWGLRYYFSQAGVRPLPDDESAVKGGSFLASPKLAFPYPVPADLHSMTIPVQTLVYHVNTPLRVMDWQTPAGFYSTGWGLIPFSFSRQSLEQIDLFQVNFMVERLPWAQIETSSIQPWPDYLGLQGRSPLAILAKPGTRIGYAWPAKGRMQLELQCGVSPDSYGSGSGESFAFEVSQLGEKGDVLGSRRLTLRPGMRLEDRDWQAIRLPIIPTPAGVLEFRYSSSGNSSSGTGAFAQSLIRTVEE
jgi:4-amino-4-deoxy-L-arabinose transferase-like glycosyltransferase